MKIAKDHHNKVAKFSNIYIGVCKDGENWWIGRLINLTGFQWFVKTVITYYLLLITIIAFVIWGNQFRLNYRWRILEPSIAGYYWKTIDFFYFIKYTFSWVIGFEKIFMLKFVIIVNINKKYERGMLKM